MPQKASTLNNSVHRLLIRRLGLATLGLCILFGALAWFYGQQRIEDDAAQLATVRVEQFNRFISDLLDAPAPLNADQLAERMTAFNETTGISSIKSGRFVLVHLYDPERQLLLERTEPDFPGIDAVQARINSRPLVPLAAGERRVVGARLDGQPFVGVAMPVTNSANKVRGQIVAVFAVSETAMAELRAGVLETLAYVIGLIGATALLLYPIILNLLGRLSRTATRLLDANLEILQVLGGAIAKRDSDTDAHNYRVTLYSVSLAESLQLSRENIRSLIKGALLHDVGKLGIRDNILLKPGKLDADEFRIMQSHVQHGMDITARAGWLKDAQPVIGGHHEKFDGSGYPAGTSGESVPLNARIFAIADVFDALTSKRPYKEPMPFDEAMQILEDGRGSHFDPQTLDAFAGIAAELYAAYSGQDGDLPQQRLGEVIDDYFKSGAADLLN